MMLQIKFGCNRPAGLRDIYVWKCGRTHGGTHGRTHGRWLESHPISSPCVLSTSWHYYDLKLQDYDFRQSLLNLICTICSNCLCYSLSFMTDTETEIWNLFSDSPHTTAWCIKLISKPWEFHKWMFSLAICEKRNTCTQGYRNFEIQIGPLDRWRYRRHTNMSSTIPNSHKISSFSSKSVSEIDYFSDTVQLQPVVSKRSRDNPKSLA